MDKEIKKDFKKDYDESNKIKEKEIELTEENEN